MNKLNREIDIVQAIPDDADAVLSLWREAADWIQAKGIDQWRASDFALENVLKYIEAAELFVAKHEGVIIGTAIIQWSDGFIWKELDNDQSGYVHKLAVKRDYGGKGLGAVLLQWAETYVRDNGKRLLRLDCMSDNEALNQYYQRQGFTYVCRMDYSSWSGSLYEKVIDPDFENNKEAWVK